MIRCAFFLVSHVCPSYANLLEKLLEIFYEKWVKHANLARLLRFQVGILSTLHTVVFRANNGRGAGGAGLWPWFTPDKNRKLIPGTKYQRGCRENAELLSE